MTFPLWERARARLPSRLTARCSFVAVLLLSTHCAATPPAPSQADGPVPPDPEAITVFGRYQPSLESLSPPGVEIGDLAMRDGRLIVHVQAESDAVATAFERALRRSGWYRDARREAVEPGALRAGEFVLSVQPMP
jgi:hypothetical protein